MTDLVSIIIPTFNRKKMACEAIDSAINQTYKETEIIVVDDGSIDGTSQYLKEKYPNITIIMKPNGGTASALNVGINQSKGQWIKWLSSDDILYRNAISDMMDQIKDKDCIYYTNYDRIDECGVIISQVIEHDRDESELWNNFYGNGSSSLIHKSVFEKCGTYDESLQHSEDYDFWLRATQIYGIKLKLIPIISVQYRVHQDQLTTTVGGSLDIFIKDRIRKQLPPEKRSPYV